MSADAIEKDSAVRGNAEQDASLLRAWRLAPWGERLVLSVRGASAACIGFWIATARMSPRSRLSVALVLAAFCGYSLALGALILRRGRWARFLHRTALVLDLVFLYILMRHSGGIASGLLPVGLLLTFTVGLVDGPVVAMASSGVLVGLAALSDTSAVAAGAWRLIPPAAVVGVATGLVIGRAARREHRGAEEIDRLRAELKTRTEEARAIEERCREVQDHLVHSERLATIGRMSAEMAHQVRNPLSSISLNLELIEDEVEHLPRGSRENVRRLLAAIHKEIDNLADITESYLRFAKLPPFRWEKADLNEVMSEVIFFARPEIEQRGITVTHRFDRSLGSVRLDKRQFKFAVMNLITNALEAMTPGGRLRIRTRAEDGEAKIMIADTGVGIRREEMDKIFDPFYTTKQGGTGLGLSLARRIIESHGGRIACESIPMVGTTFTLALPVDNDSDGEGASDVED